MEITLKRNNNEETGLEHKEECIKYSLQKLKFFVTTVGSYPSVSKCYAGRIICTQPVN